MDNLCLIYGESMDNLCLIYGESMDNLWIWLVVEPYPSEQYEFVIWDEYSEYFGKSKCSKPPTSKLI